MKPQALAASALLVLACSSSSPKSGDGGAPPAGSGSSLTGMYTFPVHFALVLPSGSPCGYETKLPDGQYNSFSLILAGASIPAVCADAANANGPVGQPFVLVQVASSSYATNMPPPDGGAVSLTAGTYAIGFEDETDDDSLHARRHERAGARRRPRLRRRGGATNVATASSGSVTLTTVGNGHIAGSFNVMMAPVTGGTIDTQSPVAFSGTFDATECPGTTQ